MNKWRRGPPPAIGWWPASTSNNINVLRWWNGRYWSNPCFQDTNPIAVEFFASRRGVEQHAIKWCARPKTWSNND